MEKINRRQPRRIGAASGAIYLSAPAYALGDVRDIASLNLPPAIEDTLRSGGLRTYAQASESVASLLSRSVTETLRSAPVAVSDIDFFVIATISGWRLAELRSATQRLMNEIGMARAIPILVSLVDCANLHSALAVAVNALEAGHGSSAVVATIDLVPPDLDRVVPPTIGILSDGAASCVLSHRVGGLRIEWMHLVNDARLAGMDPTKDQIRYFAENNRGLERVVREILSAGELHAGDFERVIFNNYNMNVAKMTALTAGFPFDTVFVDNIGRIGHVSAADNLVNLVDSRAALHPREGRRVFLLGTGQVAWGATILREVS